MKPFFQELRVGQFYSPELHDVIFNPETEWVSYFNFLACPIEKEILFKEQFYDNLELLDFPEENSVGWNIAVDMTEEDIN